MKANFKSQPHVHGVKRTKPVFNETVLLVTWVSWGESCFFVICGKPMHCSHPRFPGNVHLGIFFKKIERESLENCNHFLSVFNFHYLTFLINQPKNMTKKKKKKYFLDIIRDSIFQIRNISQINMFELFTVNNGITISMKSWKTLFFLRLSIAVFGLF